MAWPLASVRVPRKAPVDGSKALITLSLIGEIADEQVAGEGPEAGRGQRDAPRRRELDCQSLNWLEESPARRERRHRPLSRLGPGLVGMPGGGVGHVEVAVDGLRVERDEPRREVGVDERVGAEAVPGERAVEDVDGPLRVVGGVEEVYPRCSRRWPGPCSWHRGSSHSTVAAVPPFQAEMVPFRLAKMKCRGTDR